MMSLVGGEFSEDHSLVRVDLDSPGTADGFALFCDGLVHINNASRPIQQREVEACEASGVRYIELPVAADAIVLFTSPGNTVDCLSLEQVYALIGPEASGVHDWRDADPLVDALGGRSSLPDAPFQFVGPGLESGTRAALVELAIAPLADERRQVADLRADYTALQGNALILAETLRDPTNLGFVGFPAVGPWGAQVKHLAVDAGSGCVAPDEESIGSGEYPLTRTLYVYVNLDAAARRPVVEAFVDFLLSDEGLERATAAGSIRLPDEIVDEVREQWAEAQ
jgi:phosphate transport system substrate-binding protein